MTPAEAIAKLDRQIAKHGQDITLRRVVPNAPAIEKPSRAFARGYRPDELAGGIQQGDTLMILSPSTMPAEFVSTPLKVNDRIISDGRTRNVQYVDPVRIDGVIVRFNVLVRG